jgi:hypothetical protein
MFDLARRAAVIYKRELRRVAATACYRWPTDLLCSFLSRGRLLIQPRICFFPHHFSAFIVLLDRHSL